MSPPCVELATISRSVSPSARTTSPLRFVPSSVTTGVTTPVSKLILAIWLLGPVTYTVWVGLWADATVASATSAPARRAEREKDPGGRFIDDLQICGAGGGGRKPDRWRAISEGRTVNAPWRAWLRVRPSVFEKKPGVRWA